MTLQQWHWAETTASGQPILRENEKDIMIADSIGLYQGKSKISNKQKGRVYLTSQRIIHIENGGVSIELDDVNKVEYTAKFLKSSAKIIIHLKKAAPVTKPQPQVRWECPICMFENTDKSFVCNECGVPSAEGDVKVLEAEAPVETSCKQNICPVCTFINHKLIRNCEMCGTRLASTNASGSDPRLDMVLETEDGITDLPYIKLSFRGGSGTHFYKSLQTAVEDHTWAKHSDKMNKDLVVLENKMNSIGIRGLEQFQETKLLHNDIILGGALADLDKLMASANEISKLYGGTGKFSTAFGKDKFNNDSLYLDEIARSVYEFVVTEWPSVCCVSMVDLFAMFNRSRIGVSLVSPQELVKACSRFEALDLQGISVFLVNDRVMCISMGDTTHLLLSKLQDGDNVLSLSQKLDWSHGILNELLNTLVQSGSICIDQTVSGTRYYKNQWLSC